MRDQSDGLLGYSKWEWGLSIAISLAVLMFIVWPEDEERSAAKAKEKAERNAAEQCQSVVGANHMAREFVKDRLTAPSTARFASLSDSEVELVGRCRFSVFSHVDAQNSFGANVRTHYSAIMEYVPDIDRWKLITIDFE